MVSYLYKFQRFTYMVAAEIVASFFFAETWLAKVNLGVKNWLISA